MHGSSISDSIFGDHARIHLGDTIINSFRKTLPIANDATFDSHADEHNARCHPDTRTDLLREIREWADDPRGNCIFWLNGMAGTGKSTISRTVSQSFADLGVLGASFFFKRGERDRGNAALFFTTITAQLISKEPSMMRYVKDVIDDESALPRKALRQQFEKLILQPLGHIRHDPNNLPKIMIVVDALDECDRDNDVKVIIDLLSQVKALNLHMRIFITSRPELPIRLGFKNISGRYQDVALHQIPEPMIQHDISTFLRSELGRIRDDYNESQDFDNLKLPSDWPGEKDIQVLVRMAVPLFIFAATVCRFVEDKAFWNPAGQLAKVLEYQTSAHNSELDKLDATYLPVLNQLVVKTSGLNRDRLIDEFRDVVGPIVLLAEPLSVSSLARLLNIPLAVIAGRLSTLHSVLSVPSKTDSPVRMFHLSFCDFLLDPAKRATNEFWVDKIKYHEIIANSCLRLMDSSDNLRKDICGLKRPGMLRTEVDARTIYTFLPADVQYACLYWVYHLEQSQCRIRDRDQAHSFLKRHFLHWLEALSLIGKISESNGLIGTLQSLIATGESTELSQFLHDARCFILQNRGLIDIAPLQLYSSAIIFAPETSVIRRMFQDQKPRWIRRLPKMQSTWNPQIQRLKGHTSEVEAVAFSTNGQLLASASGDKTVRLWNPATGDELHKFVIDEMVTWLSFSKDGPYLETDRGLLRIRITHPCFLPSQSKPVCDVFVKRYWVARDMENLLWLPPNSRIISSALRGKILVLGQESGQITFLEFSFGSS